MHLGRPKSCQKSVEKKQNAFMPLVVQDKEVALSLAGAVLVSGKFKKKTHIILFFRWVLLFFFFDCFFFLIAALCSTHIRREFLCLFPGVLNGPEVRYSPVSKLLEFLQEALFFSWLGGHDLLQPELHLQTKVG